MTRGQGRRARREVETMTNNTPQRSIRIPDPLWTDAQDVADERGDNLSEVVRGSLRAYVNEAKRAI